MFAKLLPLILLAGCAASEPVDRGIVHKSYALKKADADRVAQALTAEVGETPGHRIVIVPDPRLNAVVVRGTPEDHVRLEKRIRELDVR
jgi:type II secretory pathway component GspD/PulD (secretin)